jgi:hypothetical protein
MCKHVSGVGVTKWKDKKNIPFISTESEDVTVDTTNKKGQTVKKPRGIGQCNKYMTGIDQ